MTPFASAPTQRGGCRPNTGVVAAPHWWTLLLFMLTGVPQITAVAFYTNVSCECGVVPGDEALRIIGGTPVVPHSNPWMAAILNRGYSFCGGSIINDRYVLTAGHCLRWSRKEDLSVILGVHDLIALNKGTERSYAAEKLILHEYFTSYLMHDAHDIGLIRLVTRISFNEAISPICLPNYTRHQNAYSGKIGFVTGWGTMSQEGHASRYLMQGNVVVMAMDDCRNTSLGARIIDSMICAYKLGTDACQGDSGGPFVFKIRPGKVEQIGLVSWGEGCAIPNSPGVYTYVPHYVNWIFSHTTDAMYCHNP